MLLNKKYYYAYKINVVTILPRTIFQEIIIIISKILM